MGFKADILKYANNMAAKV